MKTFYGTLKIESGKCPADCSACIEVCAKERGMARIRSIPAPQAGLHGVSTCIQCAEPKCIEVCPTGAIKKSEIDGVVRIDEEECVECDLCTNECPYGGMFFDLKKKKAVKCDTCDGKPRCVEACSYGLLSFIESRPIYEHLGKDLLAPGVLTCPGCAAELALRIILRILGREAIYFRCPGCAAPMLSSRELDAAAALVPAVGCLFTDVASVMTGVKRYYLQKGKDITTVAFVGDGATADIGFQALSAAAERGENIIWICYDNEAYMNTGMQRSSTTPFKSSTTTTPVGKISRGKEQVPKNMPLLIAAHGVPYMATATIAYLEDFIQKLIKAKAVKDGLVYIHLLCPCPTGWRAPTEEMVELSRMAVETNYFPLWEAEKGRIRLTYQPKKPKPVREFLKMMGRFSHLNEQEIDIFQEVVNRRFATIETLSKLLVPLA